MCFSEIIFCMLVVSLARNLQWGEGGYFAGLGRGLRLPEAIGDLGSKPPCSCKLGSRGNCLWQRCLGAEPNAFGDFASFSQFKLLTLSPILVKLNALKRDIHRNLPSKKNMIKLTA